MNNNRDTYVKIIVDTLIDSFRGQWDFLLQIADTLRRRSEEEIKFNKIYSDKLYKGENSHEQQQQAFPTS